MPGHPLPQPVIDRLAAHAVPEDELTAMCVHTGTPSRLVPRLFGTGAMTFGRHVLFRAGRYDETTPRGLALIGHEAGHITQWRRLGVPRFLFDYLRGQLATGFNHAKHPLEVPLNERQHNLRVALEAEETP